MRTQNAVVKLVVVSSKASSSKASSEGDHSLDARPGRPVCGVQQVLSLLALLVQKYKYWRREVSRGPPGVTRAGKRRGGKKN